MSAVVVITATDALAFLPTTRKAYLRLYEETVVMYALNGVKWIFALFALESFNLTTALYPFYLIIANGLFVGVVLSRRYYIK